MTTAGLAKARHEDERKPALLRGAGVGALAHQEVAAARATGIALATLPETDNSRSKA
jgi:hypothetical protein